MQKLYEKFVLNFYRYHLDSKIYRVHAPKLRWQLGQNINEQDLTLLPNMETDVVIENKFYHTQLVIDTKFYSKTLVSGYRTDIEKVRIGHLYQIYAYINNSSFNGRGNGDVTISYG